MRSQVLCLLGIILLIGSGESLRSPIQQSPEVYNNKGIALLNLNRTDEAIQAYNEAIALNSSFAIAYNNRGIALFHLNKTNEAIMDFKRATEIDPRYAEAWYNNGTALCELHRADEARASFDMARGLGYINGSCPT
jgi:tetratricopeptide (TPR) repeat protein